MESLTIWQINKTIMTKEELKIIEDTFQLIKKNFASETAAY